MRWLAPRLLALRGRLHPAPGSYIYDLVENYQRNPAVWQAFEAELGRIAGLGLEHDFCVHVFMHTHPFTTGWMNPVDRIYDQIADTARAQGMSVTDSRPDHAGIDFHSIMLGGGDPHPNPAGHAILAKSLQEGLSEDLPRGCWPE